MSHLLSGANLAVVCASRLSARGFDHVLPADCLVEMKYASHDTNSRVFPVSLVGESRSALFGSVKRPNIGSALPGVFRLEMTSDAWEEVNQAVFAILNSTSYRSKYFDEIKNDFPRIPSLQDEDLRSALAALGRRLIVAQLLRTEIPEAMFRMEGQYGQRLEKPELREDKIYVSRATHFAGVSQEVFEFELAGYQICRNWISAGSKAGIQRKGKELTPEDAELFRRVLFGIQETLEVRALIDRVLHQRLGW